MLLCLTAALSLGCLNFAEAAAIDSSILPHQYNGNEIYLDGAPAGTGVGTFSPDWAQGGGAGVTAADLTNNGTNLVYTETSNNGWVEQDGGSTPWESVVAESKWVVELSVDLNDNDLQTPDNMVMWAEGGGNRQIIVISATGVSTLEGTTLATGLDNTDGQHLYQLHYDATDLTADPSGTYQLYRDGVQIGADFARGASSGLSRLIVGDCCTGLGNPIDEYEIGHVRFGVPEPSTIALAFLGLIGLAGRRRSA